MLAILGGGLGINNGREVIHVLVFMLAGMLCLLVHEYGHALSGKYLGGGGAVVEIDGLGGAAYQQPPPTRAGYFLMVLAGPVASLLLGVISGLIMGLQIHAPLDGIIFSLMAPLPMQLPEQTAHVVANALLNDGTLSLFGLSCYSTLFQICLWWTIFNLLPLFPLDGGKLLGTLLNNDRAASIIGLVLAVILSIICLFFGQIFNAVIIGYLAFINIQYLRGPRYSH